MTPAQLQAAFRDFGPGEHIFPARFVRRFYSMLIEPATYLVQAHWRRPLPARRAM